ncbi:flagellar basal body rod protein FlgC [Maledivibacter halophilus]|uniref:Flagellar basal-body rod protein FlgC n=1 Tax=Maledivibacter halophilus TaxID=36842 RepID=A0A1T5LGH0_9FIRM|nr:flagellar basal body rod protein FlgC [Maledivibacter halophilus]SKC74468.1 flagellar basal-body rod protein FlgC [Maledivibacter halophilus]
MGFLNSINTSATGLTAERLRMDIISKNIANVNTTRTSSGMPYRRQVPIYKEKDNKSFSDFLSDAKNNYELGNGVEVIAIKDDESPFKRVYNPGHPEADEKGYILMPNVDIVTEMVNLISASRAYEANIAALNNSKSMALKALEIGR